MITLGNITLAGPLMLAPIAGFTDSPFRRIARRHGAGLVVTELISAEGIVRNNRKTMDLLAYNEEERPVAVQIFGNRADIMAEAAAIVEGLGPDVIDINMGCPARRICASGSGAALLLDPGKVFRIADSMVKRVRVPVTAKIRIGWDHGTLTCFETVKALEDAGVSMIVVHGRTRAQQYGGSADWNVIRSIAEKARVPIVGNGDIRSHGEARERMAFSGCPAVMIGRGAIGNPWIFSGTMPAPAEIVDQIKNHLDLMIEANGDRGIMLMRKHFVRYIHAFRGARHIRKDLVVANDRETVHKILDSLVEG
ncbi:MAG TPA: tRNA dihydrouridine synthase DusB [Spirochaetota bacterium]|nr:tRNA dihydrouridine synthase DusB [Spirochaetota bacterium]HPC41872.1 tRNA dihydrouridine synthase DusB [Spirochaetota bacterium]HPL18140.1 tRNA dihydrouridine synthase DusB [Spirochaetota bacterium]HQF09583.1 tRNA dihydrouridine synthase DusB [Spirochaetota bacterium]HQH98347.1 tRNA dihydrouridine synthase DusB [Spirochaetota bacterium]